jgi:PLP dependent protein
MVQFAPSPANGWADSDLAARVRDVRRRMDTAAARVNQEPARVTLIAVTKTVAVERIIAAATLGLTILGENRVQEAVEKRERLAAMVATDPVVARALAPVKWDLIGHLQTNKAARAMELFDRVQSVDSVRLAEALSARAASRERPLPILLEVNVGGEASKSGFAPGEVESAARLILALPALRVEGLMTVAPIAADPEKARPAFRALRELRDHLRATLSQANATWDELSMGMSDDFEVAIEEGATLIRIGRGLFGARPAPHQAGAEPI